MVSRQLQGQHQAAGSLRGSPELLWGHHPAQEWPVPWPSLSTGSFPTSKLSPCDSPILIRPFPPSHCSWLLLSSHTSQRLCISCHTSNAPPTPCCPTQWLLRPDGTMLASSPDHWPSLASRCSKLLALLSSLSAALPGHACAPLLPFCGGGTTFTPRTRPSPPLRSFQFHGTCPLGLGLQPLHKLQSPEQTLHPAPALTFLQARSHPQLLPLAEKPLTTTKPSQLYLQMPFWVSFPNPIQPAILSLCAIAFPPTPWSLHQSW